MRQLHFIKYFIFFLLVNYSMCFASSIQLSDFDQECARKIKQQLTCNLEEYNPANKSIFISRPYEGENQKVMDFQTYVVLFLKTCGFRVILDVNGYRDGLGVGQSIEDFMIKGIQNSSCVMAFLTKQYLTRYKEKNSGIRKEYELIQSRKGGVDFVFFPICFGNIQDCVPPLWRSLFCLPCAIPETSPTNSLALQNIIKNLLKNPLFLPQSYYDFIESVFSVTLSSFNLDDTSKPMMREDTLLYISPSNSTMPISCGSTCIFDSRRDFMARYNVTDDKITMIKTREDDDFDNDDMVRYGSSDINLSVHGSSYVDDGSNCAMSDFGSNYMRRLSPAENNHFFNYHVVG